MLRTLTISIPIYVDIFLQFMYTYVFLFRVKQDMVNISVKSLELFMNVCRKLGFGVL